MPESKLKELKREFREWCGLLSLEEILSNPDLIQVIKQLESAFAFV